MIVRKSLTQWLWVIGGILIVIGVIRLLLGTYLLGGIILGAGLILVGIALSRRNQQV